MEKAALYMRLSRDDGTEGESESIAGQRLFLFDFCRKNSFDIVREYVDDGFSGTNFDRPSFREMISDAKTKKFTVVITKDMSRLGRDYIATGEYIERFFPENGIRYIAVNDGVDTGRETGGNEMIAFRAVFNDMYAKDISKKVRCALDARRASGKFIGSTPPYGYAKDARDRTKLVPDENTRKNVERIYREFIDGKSMLSIARALSADGVLSPSAQKDEKGNKDKKWNSVMIKRILSNPTYAGDLTQGFVRKVNYKTKKRIRCGKDSRFTVCETHEPLVTKEMFEKASVLLLKYKSL